MEVMRTEKQDVLVVEKIVCNKCGKECPEEFPGAHSFVCAPLVVHWSYGSKRDMTTEKSHLCETCYEEITSTFQIPPTRIEIIEIG